MKKILTILIAGLLTISGITAFASHSANAAGRRADVDMVDACLYQYDGASRANVVIIQWNVMGWRCYLNGIKVPEKYMLEIDVKGWCKHKYGSRAAAKYDDFNNPYSWYCEY